jgi:hypothetical protein
MFNDGQSNMREVTNPGTEVGNVISKRNSVTCYHFIHVLGAITIKSNHVFYEPRARTIKCDNDFNKARAMTMKSDNFSPQF